MKKILSLILATLCITLVFCSCNKKGAETQTTAAGVTNADKANSEVFTEGDYSYVKLEDGTVKIVGYNKAENNGEVKVPEKLDGMNVTVIGANTFTEKQNVTKVRLPRFVTKVESYAFNKSPVVSVLFNQITDDTTMTIESYAFNECPNIVKVDFSKAVKKIEASAFYLGKTPRQLTFTIDPAYIDSQAIDTGKNFENIRLCHSGDISNYNNLKAFADVYGIELVLNTVNAQ